MIATSPSSATRRRASIARADAPRRLFLIAALCLVALVASAASRRQANVREHLHTGNEALDTLLMRLHARTLTLEAGRLGELSLQAYVRGTSYATRLNRIAHHTRNLLPFEATGDTSAFEALVQASYHYPYRLETDILQMQSTSRRARRQLQEVFQVLLPVYNIERPQSSGGRNAYILPFSTDGLLQYDFRMEEGEGSPAASAGGDSSIAGAGDDSLAVSSAVDWLAASLAGGDSCCIIAFRPRKEHHALLRGHAVVSVGVPEVRSIAFSCLVDFGKADVVLHFGRWNGEPVIERSTIRLTYNYGGNEGVNTYECHYRYNHITSLDVLRSRRPELDLTDVYRIDPHRLTGLSLDSVRPEPLTPQLERLLAQREVQRGRRERSLFQQLPERLVSTSTVSPFGTQMKIYGPLEPAAFGYDHLNGITLRWRLRWSRLYDSGRSLIVKPEVGYSFGLGEWRYSLDTEWTFRPERRQGLRLQSQKRSSGFSSKFRQTVNDALHARDTVHVRFDQLGLEYYDNYQTRIEHSYELADGLMLYGGAVYNNRVPVRHGQRAVPPARLDSVLRRHYADFTPYVRLTWTPRQYYMRDGRQKLYLDSPYPTFELFAARGLKNVLGSSTDYGLAELDVHQSIRLDAMRTLSYHAGGGYFLRQRGVYFINYRYFSRSQYPDSWDEHIGGTFALLDDYWFGSSPAYVQAHVMYESPFLLLHAAPFLSRYVIRERIYASSLWADGKPNYTELGYGFGNNYFSVAGFCGFTGMHRFYELGAKVSIVIDQHW